MVLSANLVGSALTKLPDKAINYYPSIGRDDQLVGLNDTL
jgi:hypothetical protein